MILILFFVVVLAVGYRATNPEERARLLRITLTAISQLKAAATASHPECETFRNVLRERTRWALATPALVAVNATIFLVMLFGAGALADPDTLVAWGGNFGPRTTNGEWWRLATSMFVHSGMLQLFVNVAALVQIGLILERLVGPLAFLAVYVTAGIFANLLNLSAYPVAVTAAASGPIFGLYGLLLVCSICGMVRRSRVTIPLIAAKRLVPAAMVFVLYNTAHDGFSSAADLAAVVVGFIGGLVLVRGVGERTPPPRRVAVVTAAALVIAVVSAGRLRGVADVRAEIERVVAIEKRTAGAYQAAFDQCSHGGITADALSELIDHTIVPELQAADTRLKALDGVPPEHQPLVASAEEYLRLRSESWRLRAEGLRNTNRVLLRVAGRTEWASDASWRLRTEALHRTNLLTLGKAETTERASLEAFQRISSPDQKWH